MSKDLFSLRPQNPKTKQQTKNPDGVLDINVNLQKYLNHGFEIEF